MPLLTPYIYRVYKVMTNVTSNLLKSVCAQNFFCATFYLNSSEFGMRFMKYVLKHFWRANMCVFIFVLLGKTSVEKPLLEYMSKKLNTT